VRSVDRVPASFAAANAPGVTASLERRITSGTWLVFGVSGAITRDRADVTLAKVSVDQRLIDASVGVRQVVTRRGAPVDVSVVALADAGGGKVDQRFDNTVPPGFPVNTGRSASSASQLMLGGSIGLALDRELIDALSVRVATPLVSVSWARTRSDSGAPNRTTATDLTAGVTIAPRLELRVSF